MEQRFNEASRKLDEKARASGAVKERAENLRERAKKLAENANSKLGILQGLCHSFNFWSKYMRKLILLIVFDRNGGRIP